MLNFFRRKTNTQRLTTTTQLTAPPKKTSAKPNLPEAIPVAQVTEGNEDSDWAEWEDSMSFMDSQLPSNIAETVKVRQVTATPQKQITEEAIDPFSRVGRKSS